MTNQKEKKKYLLDLIAKNKHMMSEQQRRTLIGQVKAKDYLGAQKGINKIREEAMRI